MYETINDQTTFILFYKCLGFYMMRVCLKAKIIVQNCLKTFLMT